VDTTRFKWPLKIRIKPHSLVLGELMLTGYFPFGLCNAPATFQNAVLGIFSTFIHDCVEVYMDDFTVYGDSFNEALGNLEKVLIRCQETNLSLSH